MSNDQIIGGIGALVFYAACHITAYSYWKKRRK